MNANRHIWEVWARNLHRWGVEDLAAALLEGAGPLALLGAQALYLGQPVLDLFLPADHLTAFANLLEEPAQARLFASFLREEPSRETT